MQNNRVVHNAIRTSNKSLRELLIKDSTKFVNELDTHNLEWRRLYNLSAITRYHRRIWLSNKELLDACFAHKRNLRETYKMSVHLYNKSYYNSYAFKYQDRWKCSSIWNIARLISLIYFISFLHSRAAGDM